MLKRFRTLALLGAVATATITALLPVTAHAASTGDFTLRCKNSTGAFLGDLNFTYKYPRTVGKNVVQTYDTVRFIPDSKSTIMARGTVTMTLFEKPYSSKKFNIATYRPTRLNWKITVDEMKAYGAAFRATVALTGRGTTTSYGTCTQ